MGKNEIKIKSYLFLQQNLAILLCVIFVIPAVASAIWQRPFLLPIVLSCGSISLLFLSIAIVTRLGCKTYDIYNEKGIKRIKGNKTIFEIEWTNIKSAIYFSLLCIIILQPYVLTIELKDELKILKEHEHRNSDCKKSIATPMSKSMLKKALKYIPLEVINKPNK